MNYIICSVILNYLCLGNVAGVVEKENEFIDSSVRNRIFTCFTQQKSNHQWYHVYPKSSRQQLTYIGNIPKQTSVKTTHFTIQLETFDNNTEIRFGPNINNASFSRPIDYVTGTLKGNEEPAFLKYNDTQKASFDCQDYKKYKTYLFIGIINTTTNMIETTDKIVSDTKFNKSHNGTVLCCMYYKVTGADDEKWITRHVAKKTVLVYDETVTVPVSDRRNSSEDKDLNSSNSTGGDAKSTGQQGTDSGKQDADSGNQATIIYIVSAVAVGFILLVGTVIYLKRCSKKPKVEVLRRNEPESLPREGPEEESAYAQIVGELRPQ